MNILIIYAHPNSQSLNAQILKTVQANLSEDHAVQLLDLYAENFDPVLRFDSHHRRRDLSKDPETEKYRQLLVWADQLIFVIPVWWGGMPAVLKGFIDRVFTQGFAYSYKGLTLVGHLKGKRAWIITTHDTPAFFVNFVQDYGRILKKQVLAMCGFKPVKLTAVPYVRGSSEAKIKKQLDRIALTSQAL